MLLQIQYRGILKTERHVARRPATFNSITGVSLTCSLVNSELDTDVKPWRLTRFRKLLRKTMTSDSSLCHCRWCCCVPRHAELTCCRNYSWKELDEWSVRTQWKCANPHDFKPCIITFMLFQTHSDRQTLEFIFHSIISNVNWKDLIKHIPWQYTLKGSVFLPSYIQAQDILTAHTMVTLWIVNNIFSMDRVALRQSPSCLRML